MQKLRGFVPLTFHFDRPIAYPSVPAESNTSGAVFSHQCAAARASVPGGKSDVEDAQASQLTDGQATIHLPRTEASLPTHPKDFL